MSNLKNILSKYCREQLHEFVINCIFEEKSIVRTLDTPQK